MALNPPSPWRVRPLPVTLATIAAVTIFIVVLAVAARMTADSAVVVARHDRPAGGTGVVDTDAGVAGADDVVSLLDGGTPDAGVLITVEGAPDAGPEPDAGPPTVEEPPYEPSVVAAAAAVVVESCAKDALRWDPSLGGAFTLRIEFPVVAAVADPDDIDDVDAGAGPDDGADDGANPAAPPRLLARGLTSPVLEACLLRRADQMVRAPGTRDLVVPQAVEARAVLRADGTIGISDATVVAVTGR